MAAAIASLCSWGVLSPELVRPGLMFFSVTDLARACMSAHVSETTYIRTISL